MIIPPVNPVKSLGQTIYTGIVAALLLVALGMFAWGQFQSWRSGTWKDRAEDAAASAQTAQANANSANAGAANATQTRGAIDTARVDVHVTTEAAAQRAESYANRTDPVVGLDPVDPAVVQELSQAEARARAAAGRLQRAKPR